MELIRVLLVALALIITVSSIPNPSGGHHHIVHRIHVPQKIKTIYHTKIIKVPEHHHHFHEKEKIIQIEKPKKEEHLTLHHEDLHSFEEDDALSNLYGGGEEHNIFKKHAVAPKNTKTAAKKARKRKVEKKD